jgi:gluconolactonase
MPQFPWTRPLLKARVRDRRGRDPVHAGAMSPTLRLSVTLAAALAAVALAAAAPAAITSEALPYPAFGEIERLDPALDALLAPDAKMQKLGAGFNWSEGPVWMPKESQLVFSDVPEDIAYRWREGAGIDVFLQPSGFTGTFYDGRERGSNGLGVDLEGRLLLCQHGDRRIARLAADGRSFETVADRFDGKRFNSPNDLCVDRRGNVYFTDPPYGVGPGTKVELDFQGVYQCSPDGTVVLLSKELARPNGIALSPDEKTLYVANSDGALPVIMAFQLRADGTAGPGRIFFDSRPLRTAGRRGGAMDGMEVDAAGNLWATGPGGVLVLSPEGKHLGTLLTGRATANCCFGDADGGTLYMTADDTLVRVRTKTKGLRF